MTDSQPARLYLRILFGTLLAAYLVFSGYIEGFGINFYPRSFVVWKNQMSFIDGASEKDPTVLLAGDSRALVGWIPQLIGPGTRSISLAGSTPIAGYFTLRRYLANHEAPDYLVLSYSPMYFEGADSFWEITVRYKFLAPGEILPALSKAIALEDPVLGETNFALFTKWARYRLNIPSVYMPTLKGAKLWGRRERNRTDLTVLQRTGGHIYYSTKDMSSGLNVEAEKDVFDASPVLAWYFEQTLRLAVQHAIEVIVTTMPFNQGSWEAANPRYIAAYQAFMEGIRARHPACNVGVEMSHLPNDHFGDPSHLNPKGAAFVSGRLAEYLGRYAETGRRPVEPLRLMPSAGPR